MALQSKSSGVLVLRLLVGLALLGWPRMGWAAGTWSVISLPQKPGEVVSPTALAVDTAGDLYVADGHGIQKRDAQGNWSVIATVGTGPGQVGDYVPTLAADATGNLYVAEGEYGNSRMQKRDAQGNWSVIAPGGDALGQVVFSWSFRALAVDSAGNLYVADGLGGASGSRIQKRDAQGSWSVIATAGKELWPGSVVPVGRLTGFAVDAVGNLYVSGYYREAFGTGGWAGTQKRDAQGNWSVADFFFSGPLTVDASGNLYAADPEQGIQKRDSTGNWSVIATEGTGIGQAVGLSSLAVDGAGNLYVAETDSNRVLKYTPDP